MHNAENKHVPAFQAVDDKVCLHWKSAVTRAKIIARAADVRRAGKEEEPVRDAIDEAVSGFYAAALLCDVIPDFIEIAFSFRRYAMCHQRRAVSSAKIG